MNARKSAPAYLVLALVVAGAACSTLGEIASALNSLRRIQFKLGPLHDFRLAGIPLSRISSLDQLSVQDAAALLAAFQRKQVPAGFVLDVLALNPNGGNAAPGGAPNVAVTLTGLESRLLIDTQPTVTGNIQQPVQLPGGGETTDIPIQLGLDLYQFFGNRGYQGLINLALALGGARSDPTRVALDAKPTISTPYGPMTYPGRITIVSAEFRGGGAN